MLSVIFGLVGVVVGIFWLISWGGWSFFLVVLQGSVPPFLILVGLIAVAAGVSSIKDNIAAKKEEEKEGDEESAESSESESSSSEEKEGDKESAESSESSSSEEEKKEESSTE